MPGNYSKVETVVTGQAITAAERNTEHDNHITYQTPAGTDDYSATVTEMRTVSDPYPAGTPSQPTSLAGELERLRYVGVQVTGKTYWYEDPGTSIEALLTHAHTGSPDGGQVDHGGLAGLADNDHTQYRLESADHSHVSTGAQGGQLDHGAALTGLTDDDHTQYVLLAGRASGQAIFGGTAASETLTLKSTSHSTKGKVIFGAAGTTAYDEVNERLGVGTNAPDVILHAKTGSAGGVETARLESGTGGPFLTFYYSGGRRGFVGAAAGNENIYTYSDAGDLYFGTNADAVRWRITSSGHLLAGADNTYDIGASGATRPRNMYLAGNLVVGGTITGTVSGVVNVIASESLAVDSTAWTTAQTTYLTFSSRNLTAGDIVEVPYSFVCTGGASTTNGIFYVGQSAGTAVVKLHSTSGVTLSGTGTKVALAYIPSVQTTMTGTITLYCTSTGTATFILQGKTDAANAASSSMIASLRQLRS